MQISGNKYRYYENPPSLKVQLDYYKKELLFHYHLLQHIAETDVIHIELTKESIGQITDIIDELEREIIEEDLRKEFFKEDKE